MEDYYEYLDSNGVTTLYKLIKDDTVALIDSYSVTINGITTTLDTHTNNSDIHTPISDIENMVDTKISGLVNSAPETLDTLKELADALGNDANFATTVVNQIGNKADKDTVYTKLETDTLLEGKANSKHNHVVSDITDMPTIPTKTSQLINDSGFLTSSSGVITSVSWSDITNKPNFATVATSGSYNDLFNKPTIPKVYNKTLTIQKNGTNVAIFTSNSNTDVTADITVPTKVSELSNDSGFITGISWDKVTNKPTLATVATSGSYTDLSNTPTIPTKVSQLENDMGFGTGGDTSDCVHKTGNETINGTKTFTVGPVASNSATTNGYFIKLNAITRNEVPSQLYHATFRAYDKNDKILGEYCVEKSTTGCTLLNMNVRSEDSNGKQLSESLYLNMSNDGSAVRFYPSSNNKVDLGMSNHKWAKVYSDDVVHTSGNEHISGTKMFSHTIHRYADLTTSGGIQVYRFVDTNANCCGHIFNNVHWHDNAVYNRHGAYNAKSGKSMEIDITSNDTGVGMAYVAGTATKGNLVTATSATGHTAIATMGWVNNPATSTNVVHRSGDETIAGNKTFSNRVSFPSGYYITTDANDNSLRIIRAGSNHGNVYKIIIQGDNGKIFAPNGFKGNLQGNADTATSATKAIQDSAGQQINKTYIKELSVNGRTITYKRGDNTTGTITTQDTNTTYSKLSQFTNDSGFITSSGSCANATNAVNATNATQASYSNQLQAFTGDDFTGGNHFVKAIRSTSGWSTRLWMCYNGGAKTSNEISVAYADSAGSAGNGVDSCGGNYVKFKDGTQICWGSNKGGDIITFANAFTSTPSIAFGYNIGSDFERVIHGQARYSSSTSFIMQVWDFNSNAWVHDRSAEWIAIGRWK